jgi:hypothetical protein
VAAKGPPQGDRDEVKESEARVALPSEDADWITFLATRHDADIFPTQTRNPGVKSLRELDAYYEGTQPLTYMHPDLLREVQDRIQPVVIFWPQLVVDSVEERLDPEGFGLPDDDAGDDDLWRVWQANDLDEESQLGRVDALVMRRSYLSVGANEDDADTPLVTVESPLEMYAYVDPRTRRVAAALKRTFVADTTVRVPERYATLYLPDRTVWYDWSDSWREIDRDEHHLGESPVVPLVNRARTADRCGRSELTPIIPLSDAANKLATDMMVAAEFVAIPLRGLFGVGPEDLEDSRGNKLTALQAILGKLLTIPDDDGTAKHFEFASANLANFHESINSLAKLVASMAGLPPHALGFTTDNPASADAIRSAEARLVKRAERKQVAFGGTYEKVMRLVRRIQESDWDPRLKRLETKWRDASTPTIAQKADAAVKLYNLPVPIVPLRQTREDLGYTDAQIQRMEVEDTKAAAESAALFKLPTAAEQAGAQAGTTGGDPNQPAA